MSSAIASATEPLVNEKALADSWGLTVRDLALCRQARLRERYHWELHQQTVHYTPEGVAELTKWLEPALAALPVVEVEAPAPPKDEWVVIRSTANPRLVLGQHSGTGERGLIFVKANRNFRRGMALAGGGVVADESGRMRFTGRLPRFYGRW